MNENFMNCSNEEFFYWIILFAFCEKQQREWERLRNIDSISAITVNEDYENYFKELFRYEIPTHSIKKGKSLFRARHIRNEDNNKLVVNIHDIVDEYCKIVLSDDEISKIEEFNSTDNLSFSLQHLFLLKTRGMNCFTEEQQKKIDKLIEENSLSKIYGFSEADSRVPPPLFRKAGRLNDKNDAYLYLSFHKDTAIYEMRPSIDQKYSLAEFRTNKDLVVADLTGKYEDPPENTLLLFISNKISEPNTDNKDDFYNITQFMSHVLQEKGFDGIMYRSSTKIEENNILLFDESNVDFIFSEIVAINNIEVEYSNILPFVNSNDDNNS